MVNDKKKEKKEYIEQAANSETVLVPIRDAAAFYGVDRSTLRRWCDEGIIQFQRTKHGQRRFPIPKNKESSTQSSTKRSICYCRVSSSSQRNDLRRQIEFMQQKFPHFEVLSDIGSGINWKRQNFKLILELAQTGALKELVVAHRDRLCRFAFELVQSILEFNNVKLLVLDDHIEDSEWELTEDLLSIIQIYVCKKNGRRRYAQKTETNKSNGEENG